MSTVSGGSQRGGFAFQVKTGKLMVDVNLSLNLNDLGIINILRPYSGVQTSLYGDVAQMATSIVSHHVEEFSARGTNMR